MRRALPLLLLLLGTLAATAPPAAAAPRAPGFSAGAARVDTTPPRFGAPADRRAFPGCAAARYTGRRVYALQEPYTDANGNGRYDSGEPSCDANHNGRYDGIYVSGGPDHIALRTHDPIDARALALTSGRRTVVIVSVVAQGIFQNVIERIRARARALRPGIGDVIVSANHNESSPDTVGIYGAPDIGGFGANSGQDDFYLSFLVSRAAHAAVLAYDRRRPARLFARQFRTPPTLRVELSDNFPTTDDAGRAAAIDPKVGLLQARDLHGRPIATVMSLAAHNQEIGHASASAHDLSSDWPGAFHRALERRVGGMAMYLVGDNGSEEDPVTVPPVSAAAHPECADGCYAQAQATGAAWARAVAGEAPRARRLRVGVVRARRQRFFVPIENNLFKVAAKIGLFGARPTYTRGVPAGRLGTDLRTEVGVVDVGPDLQLVLNPGEAFPALMLGSPWGIEDAGCPDRANPPVPTWRARAAFRFQVGLADDFVGYEIPAWGNSSEAGTFTTNCVNDGDDRDPKGHQHKLEDEGVGPATSNGVARHLTALLSTKGEGDPLARVAPGRFIRPDGSLSRRAAGAVGIELKDGSLIGRDPVDAFDRRRVRSTGTWMDYDGQPQCRADGTTRGMLVRRAGRVVRRFYVDVYPALAIPRFHTVGMHGGPAPRPGTTPVC